MGTRSLTIPYENKGGRQVPIYKMHRQFDGYPEGHGVELAEFLADFTMMNGLTPDRNGKIANGMDCLAAQMIAHFKTEPGNIYVMSVEIENAGQEYEYHVQLEYGQLIIKVISMYDGEIFNGTAQEFLIKYPPKEE